MKKLLAIVLAVVMVLSMAACAANQPNETTAGNTTNAPTNATTNAPTDPKPTDPAIEKGTSWNSVTDFHKEEDASSVWQYYFFDPEDSSYNAMQVFLNHEDQDIHSWYPWQGSWVGVGFNNGEFCDVYGQLLEQNADGPNGMVSAIGFIAPADGEYVVTGKLMNAFDQDADVYSVVKADGTVITSENYRDYIKGGYTFLTPTKVSLTKGDVIYFRPGSTNGWVSSYSDLTVYYEPTDASVMEKPEGFIPVPDYPDISIGMTGSVTDARKDFNTESATEGPWVYAITTDGVTFNPLLQFIKREWDEDPEPDALEWYMNADDYVGLGINADVADFLEANISDTFENGGSAAALGYKAAADGKYSLTVFTKNVFAQNADKVVASLNGEIVAELPFTTFGNVQIVDVTLKAGETIYFYGVSNGDWVSAYMQIFVNETSAVGGFSTETADGQWIYASTSDGKEYTVNTKFDTPDWTGDGKPDASQWYSEGGTGIGFNNDMGAWIEANVNGDSGDITALGFKAPAAGKYEITVCSLNAWGQNGGDVVVSFKGQDVGTTPFLDVPFGSTITVDMAEGEVVYIHGTSNGGWVSCYLQVAANKVG